MGFLGGEKLIVGYDLGNEYSQISYALSADGEAETFSQVAGAESYNIPTVLCKCRGANRWYCGREALRHADEDGILVENLPELALNGEPVIIDGESYDPAALLTLFFRRSLGMLSQVKGRTKLPEKISALMVTCDVADRSMSDVMKCVVEGIRMKADRVFLQSHAESFYTYMLRQPGELRMQPPVLFEYEKDGIRVRRMKFNRRTTPVVVFVEESRYPFPETEDPDAAFGRIAEEVCAGVTGSVYLIGDGFNGDWMKNSLRFLCRGRRVFQGNNLFSKGACCGMQERLEPCAAGKEHVFLGEDRLKANIGMEVLRQGEPSYLALLDAGMNLYEAEQTTELYLQEGNELILTVTPLIRTEDDPQGSVREVRIILNGLAEPARLRLYLFLKAENRLEIQVEDLGFGEFREPSGRRWQESVDL